MASWTGFWNGLWSGTKATGKHIGRNWRKYLIGAGAVAGSYFAYDELKDKQGIPYDNVLFIDGLDEINYHDSFTGKFKSGRTELQTHDSNGKGFPVVVSDLSEAEIDSIEAHSPRYSAISIKRPSSYAPVSPSGLGTPEPAVRMERIDDDNIVTYSNRDHIQFVDITRYTVTPAEIKNGTIDASGVHVDP